MNTKTLLFLNLRFSDFYSKQLFSSIKQPGIRLVAIIDEQFKNRIGPHILPFLDEIHFIKAQSRHGFLAEFNLDSIRPIVKNEKINTQDLRIICTDEFNLLNAGQLRREFNLEGNTDEALVLYRDKIVMKRKLAEAGIRVPHFMDLKVKDTFASLTQQIGLPFVIKPIDSCGSDGVDIIYTEQQFLEFKKNHPTLTQSFEVEEYIQGKLFHVDSHTQDLKIQFICANEYSCPNFEFTQGKTLASIPLDSNDPLSIRLIHFAKSCLDTLGGNNLINHMEIFVTNNDELVFLETSARPPGGLINFTHNINFGVNLMDKDLCMQAGLTVKLPQQKQNLHVFSALFPLIPGRISELTSPKTQSACDITWFAQENQLVTQKDCSNIVSKAAQALFYHHDKKILRKDFDTIKNQTAVRVAPC